MTVLEIYTNPVKSASYRPAASEPTTHGVTS